MRSCPWPASPLRSELLGAVAHYMNPSESYFPSRYWQGTERRRAPRRKLLVQVDCENPNAMTLGPSIDISESGLLIATAEELEPGTPVLLRFALPALPNAMVIQANGTIVRTQHELMVAVQFTDLPDEAREAVRSFVQTRQDK